ncbi:MAG TPA: ABC transporter permease [Planctomycetota bacterium]|nr:ABC transporter permease [Planctomycetota bacterium]
MKNFLALTRRELGVYFVSPMAYIILTALLAIAGWAFWSTMANAAEARLPVDFSGTLAMVVYIVVLSSALVTMRLIAEEKSKGTLEIMLTAPVSDAAFVLAKFAASMVLLVYLLVLTVGYLVIISRYGLVDYGAVACGYLGVLLTGAVTYSIGLFVSSLCSSQVTAGVITLAVSLLLILADLLGANLAEGTFWREFLGYIDLTRNFGDFLRGVVDRSRLVYLTSVVAFFLFLTTRVVESRRWR